MPPISFSGEAAPVRCSCLGLGEVRQMQSWEEQITAPDNATEQAAPAARTQGSDEYNARVQKQIEQYASQAIHDLPDIFHLFSHNFIRPGLMEVFGVGSVNDFYLAAAEQSSGGFKEQVRILSVGCGDGSVELELAEALCIRGINDFRMDAFDLSPLLIERFLTKVKDKGLEHVVHPRVTDLNQADFNTEYDMVMANHSLHHIVDLEQLFDMIFARLTPSGIFATSDMIGRNGHLRWPETELILQSVWPLLSKEQKFHHQLSKFHLDRFEDHDCSGEGFEGIRAQDILYLALNRFSPHKFLAFGGFIDVLVDRGFGPGFRPENERDKNLIMSMCKLNDFMLDADMIKPTMMMAYFTKDDRPEVCYHGRSAVRSLRLPFADPPWIGFTA